MPTDALAELTTDDLVGHFEQAAIAYGVAQGHDEEEDVPETNWGAEMERLDKEKWAIYREVRRRGPEAEAAFLRLLRHPEPYVRAEAAMDAIHFSPAEAEPVLVEISGRRGWIGFYARKVLGYYRAGLTQNSKSTEQTGPG